MNLMKIKKSIVPGKVPASLEMGELGVNLADRILYVGDANRVVQVLSSAQATLQNGMPAYIEPTSNTLVSIATSNGSFLTKTNGAKNFYLNVYGDISSNMRGLLIPRNALITSITASIDNAIGVPCTFSLRLNGAATDYQAVSIPAGQTWAIAQNLAKPISLGDQIAAYCACSVSIANPIVSIEYSWRN